MFLIRVILFTVMISHLSLQSTRIAQCVISSDLGATGSLTLIQNLPTGPTGITGRISGLRSGGHGFHIHQFGDTSMGCRATGPDYNPQNCVHGGPLEKVRHLGDLGNILAGNNGMAMINFASAQVTLYGPHSVLGRSLVIHAFADDLGKGTGSRRVESLLTGNSGAPVACCTITLSQP